MDITNIIHQARAAAAEATEAYLAQHGDRDQLEYEGKITYGPHELTV